VELPSAEVEELRSSIRRSFTERLPPARLRELMEQPGRTDDALWSLLSEQLELPGLLVAEQDGGWGAGPVELAVVAAELGRALVPGPALSTLLLSAPLIARSPLAAQLATGDLRAALAWAGPGRGAIAPTATYDGGAVTGSARSVLSADAADVLLVPADMGDGTALLAVRREDAVLTPLTTLDLTVTAADVSFAAAPAQLVADRVDLEPPLALSRLALAGLQVGGAERCLEVAVEHAKTRQQFGRAIGSFQAVKHKLADVLVAVEMARSAVDFAAWSLANDEPEAGLWVSTAASWCGDAYLRVATSTIQVLGGIGFTWEHQAHLHYRRARSTAALLGSPRWHRHKLAEQLEARA
jgi:alkylation response protein AidB-like acyl-CoA dehydrogenase